MHAFVLFAVKSSGYAQIALLFQGHSFLLGIFFESWFRS